jgi:biopolymer transport protein ExbD
MSKRHIPESHTAHPNVTPLIDIIMCLIIFFMLVAKIGVTTGAEEIKIPKTIYGTKISDMGNTLTLNIPDASNNISSDMPTVRALVAHSKDETPVMQTLPLLDSSGQNQLLITLEYYKQQFADFKVIIRADGEQNWRAIQPVLLTINQAGVRNVFYNTEQEK